MLSKKVELLSTLSANNVKIEDLICPICCSTLMEPVLLPCRHGFCFSCFDKVIKYNSLTCPCCRKRFATWLRKAKKEKDIVCQELWSYIKNKGKVTTRKNEGKKIKDFVDPINDILSVTAPGNQIQISQPGEIRKEYEEQLQAFRKQVQIEKENELKASAELIVNLLKKESEALRTSTEGKFKETMLVANPGHTPYSLNTKKNFSSKPTFVKTSEDVNSSSTLTASSSSHLVKNLKTISVRINRESELIKHTAVHKAYLSKFPSQFASGKGVLTVPPTDTHRSPDRNSGSTDSLNLEMCHFKPIRTVPTTPHKRSTAPIIKTPKAKRVVFRDRNNCHSISPKGRTMPDLAVSSRLSAFCHVRSTQKSPQFSQHRKISSSAAIRILFRNEMLSPKTSEKILGYKNPVVRLKRCRINAIQSTTSKKIRIDTINSKDLHTKRKYNGQLSEDRQQVQKIRRSNRSKDFADYSFLSTGSSPEEIETLEKIIEEQKKCEEIIIQERIDFELAKKIAASSSPKKRNTKSTFKNAGVVTNLRRRTTRNSVKT